MGFIAKSFFSLHAKRVVGFCSRRQGLTLMRAELASAGGDLESVCSATSDNSSPT